MSLILLLLSLLAAVPLGAQTSTAVATWIRLDAPPGREAATAATLMRALPGWRADQWGNLTRTVGSGAPRRVVACGLDYPAWVVSEITDRGYLRVRMTGLPTHPLWHQLQRDRIIGLARANRIPYQVGTTRGGTDGSSIAPWGPPNLGLSWPGRYSHGPAEVLDLKDVRSLARILRVLVMAL